MNRVRLRCANLSGLNIFDHLRCEEIVFRNSMDNWFLFNTGPVNPTIILGLSGKIPSLVNVPRVANSNVTLIRRFTGGGTVIVDGNTIFSSFIMNAENIQIAPYPRDIMAWSEKIYKPVFEKLNPDAQV